MLVFDVGGTFIKYAIFNNQGDIIVKSKVATPNGNLIPQVIIDIYNQLSQAYSFKQIGVSTAGQVDVQAGEIVFAGPTIPNYTGTKLKNEIVYATGCKVFVENDVTACIYNFEEIESMLYVALGTGIGGAYKLDNKVHYGDNGRSFEIGHMYHQGGNTFEEICSTKSLLNNYYLKTKQKISGEQLDKLYIANDEVAISVVNQFLKDIAVGLVNLVHILDCNTIMLGGGVVEAKFFQVEKIVDEINNLKVMSRREINISISPYLNDAPLYGMNKYIRGLS